MNSKIKSTNIFIYFPLLFIAFVCLFPFYIMLLVSLEQPNQIFSFPVSWFPKPVMIMNWIIVWIQTPLARHMLNSIIIAIGTIFLTIFISLPAAYALAKRDVYGKQLILLLILITQMITAPIIIVSLFKVISLFRLIDNLLSIIIIKSAFSLALSTLLLTGFIEKIPSEIEDSAKLDCSTINIIIKIFLPLIKPGLLVTAVFIFVAVWNDFILTFVMISSSKKYTFVVSLYNMLEIHPLSVPQWHMIMTAALFGCIPVQILFLSIRKLLAKGITAGAIK